MILMWSCPGNILAYYLDKTTLLYKWQIRKKRQNQYPPKHKYMATHFYGLVQELQYKVAGFN